MEFIKDKIHKYQIVWDLGRRCTYACSYCPPHRNNKTSRLVDFDDMVKTMRFIDEYVDLYQTFRKIPLEPNLSFTGGEPTIHPDIFKFAKWIKDEYGEKYGVNLTTNGAFAGSTLEMVKEHIDGGTISYHPESTEIQKKMVVNTIMELGHKMGVNVMFSKYHFDECVELCKKLDAAGIKYKPRRIGDDGDDATSIANGYTHIYSEEQEKWFNDFYGVKEAKKGRGCCSGRCMGTEKGDTFYLPSTNFEGWSCGVNWYFLYINSETRDVYTHQTCMVNLNGEVAPLGSLDDASVMIDDLATKLYSKTMPTIKCPKKHCGCGLCADKAKKFEDFTLIQREKVHSIDFHETIQKPLPKRNPFRVTMEQIDESKKV